MIYVFVCSFSGQSMVVYNPGERMSAKKAMLHLYFEDLDIDSLPAALAGY